MINTFNSHSNLGNGKRLNQEPIRYSDEDTLSKSLQERELHMYRQIDWMKRLMDYSAISAVRKCRYDLKKGDIFEVDWGVNVNAEFSLRHYGVVLKDSDANDPLVLVCPLKTQRREPHPKSDFVLGEIEGLKTGRTIAVVNQIKSIDKFRLYSKQIINYNMTDEVNLRMDEYMVNDILDAYVDFISGLEITQIYQ